MKRTQLFTLAGLMIASSGYASATTIDFLGLDATRSATVAMDVTYLAGDLMLDGQPAASQTTVTEELAIGVLNLTFDGSLQLRDAFCVDRFSYISNGQYDVTLSAPGIVNQGERAAWLLHNVLPQINAAVSGAEQSNLAAALQMAIWDVVHDNGDGFEAGRIQQSSNPGMATDPIILSLAKSLVSQSEGQTWQNARILSDVNVQNLTQRLMVDQPGSDVPEPSTWALALTGLAFAALGRRRRA